MEVRRVMAITPHGDDVTLFAGGTLAKWAGQGCDITVVRVTNDEKDSCELGLTDTIAKNRAEFESAMALLGVTHTEHLDYRDCELMDAPYGELREKIIRLIRIHKPQMILSFDPMEADDENPDHRVVARAVADASWAAAYPNFHPEHAERGLGTHVVAGSMYFTRHFIKGDELSDIKEEIGVKTAAVVAHRNMMRSLLCDQKAHIKANGFNMPELESLSLDGFHAYWEMIVSAAAMMAAEGTPYSMVERFRSTMIKEDDPLIQLLQSRL